MKTLPQITAPYNFIVNNLQEMGISHKPVVVKATKLKPLQEYLSSQKLEEFKKYNTEGYEMGPIFISKEGYIIDGHHRAAGKIVGEGRDSKIKAIMIDCDYKTAPYVMGRIQDRWEMVSEAEDRDQESRELILGDEKKDNKLNFYWK